MPIYAYKCESCGHTKDVLQKISDALLTVCPQCGATFKKQLTAAGFQLKGSGWYVTDFRGGASAAVAAPVAEGAVAPADAKAAEPAAPAKSGATDSAPAAPAKPAAVTPAATAPSAPRKAD